MGTVRRQLCLEQRDLSQDLHAPGFRTELLPGRCLPASVIRRLEDQSELLLRQHRLFLHLWLRV